jgi:hypothetical protein|tara:strand:- start:2632 stop:2910 length:279 start_codon:yes stop_codon:yes gene_type:complete
VTFVTVVITNNKYNEADKSAQTQYKIMKEENKKWLSLRCNKKVNGTCYSYACLIRGGWKRKDKVDYDLATCTPLEILKELEKTEESAVNIIT